ncbi:SGNH/GDSL hydrolase family protein [Terriglobus saanensis]|uniref:Lipolytic protein G-D-S-L family n=1 Tax=Terriglobus saanensis (strain ATCC BAA-1853 / DSM 23119 / SP1PR4) TaxID=401053 RepID=E8UXS9_TERSS|nr:SGNH/GDSL hydrolase family protein [Terriglobus saanensis]ADV83095.1 lipolytic protein G-D-S-L family [Terriglobus saanensis SP1PR4]
MRTPILRLVILVSTVGLLGINVWAAEKKIQEDWVSAWSTAVHEPLAFPGLPPTPVFDNQTIRMIVRPAIGSGRVRIRFSNAYGASVLEIGAAHIAVVEHGSAIIPATDRVLTFGGSASVKVPPGAPILTDPVDLKISPFTELAITIFLPHPMSATTTHFWAQHETYVSGPGDFTGSAEIQNASVTTAWYWLASVEVPAASSFAAVVTFGDSITDGVGAKQGQYEDWPDQLAKRLSGIAVLNEGIGGNRILHDGAGVSALARFDRDVLAQPSITSMIVLEGINDIGWPHMKPPAPKNGAPLQTSPFAGETVTSKDLIVGLRQLIDRAHQHGIRVFGATLTPYEGAGYFSQDGETVRQEVNQWIRSSGAFDDVMDFDAAVRDPRHPSRFREEYQSGDYLHPSAAGYRAMAAAIDIEALRTEPHQVPVAKTSKK